MSDPGLPANFRPLTLGGGIRAAARRAPDKVAISSGDASLTYRAVVERINRVANAATGLGLPSGAHVALLAPNCIEYLEVVAGLADAGLAVVTANPHSTPAELAAICEDAEVRALFVHAGHGVAGEW